LRRPWFCPPPSPHFDTGSVKVGLIF
jgi:hypothetical protein